MRISLPHSLQFSSRPSTILTPFTHQIQNPTIRTQQFYLIHMATTTPAFSSNYDAEQGKKDLMPLLKIDGGKWSLISSGKGVERSFKFKTFKKTWEFMNTIASECAVKKHHPEWSNVRPIPVSSSAPPSLSASPELITAQVYNTTFIRWTTHSPPGLSEKDIIMAKFCDEKAKEFGELEVESPAITGDEEGGVGKELADRVAKEGGDCCVPKKKEEGFRVEGRSGIDWPVMSGGYFEC